MNIPGKQSAASTFLARLHPLVLVTWSELGSRVLHAHSMNGVMRIELLGEQRRRPRSVATWYATVRSRALPNLMQVIVDDGSL